MIGHFDIDFVGEMVNLNAARGDFEKGHKRLRVGGAEYATDAPGGERFIDNADLNSVHCIELADDVADRRIVEDQRRADRGGP